MRDEYSTPKVKPRGRRKLAIVSVVMLGGVAALTSATEAQTVATAPATASAVLAADLPGRALLADVLIDEARVRGRNSALPADLAAGEALTLLQVVQRLTPDNPDMLRLLAEAARATDHADIARDAYHQIVKADPNDLVAQVQFMDMVAMGKPVEQRLAIFQAALGKSDLNPQVRSEMAVRVGKLQLERGQGDEAMKSFQQALTLNDVNVGAWQEIVRYLAIKSAPAVDRMNAFTGLLMANPYQPDALASAAHLLSSTGNHDLATDYLNAALEQVRISTTQAPADGYLELAMELALANRNGEAQQLIGQLVNIENGPPSVPLFALLLRNPDGPGTAPPVVPGTAPASEPGVATTAPAMTNDSLVNLMRKRGDAAIAAVPADGKPETAIADALWADLIAAPDLAANTAERLDKLKTILGDGNAVYQRLLGWKLLREGKTNEARAVLEPLSAKDGVATLGMVRLWAMGGNTAQLKPHLQDLWNSQPSPAIALLIKQEADRDKVVLDAMPEAAAMRAAAAKYPASLLLAHRNPHDLIVVLASLSERRYGLGEPIVLTVSVKNQADRPFAVGPSAVVSNSLAVGGRLRGIDTQDLGVFAIDTSAHVYRIERRGTLTQTIRVDQGLLRDLLYNNPTRLFSLGLGLITAPHPVGSQVVPGLGGQRIVAGEFEREGLTIGNADQLLSMLRDLPRLPADRQMVLGAMLEAIVYNLPEDRGAGAPGAVTMADVRKQMIDSILQQIKNGSPVVQAWLLRQAPARDLPPVIIEALNNLQDSPDPLVRVTAYSRALILGRDDAINRAKLVDAYKRLASQETDPLAERWAELLSREAKLPPPTPATAPASEPGG